MNPGPDVAPALFSGPPPPDEVPWRQAVSYTHLTLPTIYSV